MLSEKVSDIANQMASLYFPEGVQRAALSEAFEKVSRRCFEEGKQVEFERVKPLVEFIDYFLGQENMTFMECSQAEDLWSRAKQARAAYTTPQNDGQRGYICANCKNGAHGTCGTDPEICACFDACKKGAEKGTGGV